MARRRGDAGDPALQSSNGPNASLHPLTFDLGGRAALVTGSSRGIGRAIARAFAEAGASVALHGRAESAELARTLDELAEVAVEAVAVSGDLRQSESAKRIVDEAAERLGRLDILVNNAGFVVPCAADEMDEATWDAVVDVNLRSAFFCAQAASRHMRANGFGRIVNISSQGGEVAIPTYVHYGVSKAGLNVMTRYLAVEWAQFGITVNAVAPAFVRTDLTAEVFRQLPDLYEDQLARVPKRRMCEPEEVAAAVLYLASAAADFTTGEILHVDGGYLAL
jgi:NAD(P)-dependent dehydrogenase (short-subunit alcohol dehydrogenase family)